MRVLTSVKLTLVKRLNAIIAEITYGKIPEGIFKKFQDKVDAALVDSNPAAVSQLKMAYESLGQSEDPEKASNVAFNCRRLIKAVADELFPARDDEYVPREGKSFGVGKEQFLNRLHACADSLESDNRKYMIKKVKLLRDVCGEIPQSINKGTHADITNADAEMLVIYSYLILGELILENQKRNKMSEPQKSTR